MVRSAVEFARWTAIAIVLMGLGVSARSEDAEVVLADTGFDGIQAWLGQIGLTLTTNTDPMKRAIVCRAAFQDFSLHAMRRATGLPRETILRAAEELEVMGLIRVIPTGPHSFSLKPFNDEARKKMSDWAFDWCVIDDTCKTLR